MQRVKAETSCTIRRNELKLSNTTNSENGCLSYKEFAVVVVGDEVYTSAPCKKEELCQISPH